MPTVNVAGAHDSTPSALPADPLQATARLALAGKWGVLPDWKRKAYERVVEQGITLKGRVWLTAYYPWEGRSGRVDARGNPCTSKTCACNWPRNKTLKKQG